MRAVALSCIAGLVLAACGAFGGGGSRVEPEPLDGRTPVVVDGDFGPDDMMALLYLLGRDDVSVRAVTVTGTGLAHCPAGAENAAAVLAHVGRTDIPVACGTAEPLAGDNAFPDDWRAGTDGLTDRLGVAASEQAVEDDAVDLLVDTVVGSPAPVRLLALGPLTNLAGALEREPDFAANVERLAIMGGAIDVNGSVAPDYAAEWNIWVDPVAANRVLQAGMPTLLVPLDATNDVPATRFFYEALGLQKATPAAELVHEFLTVDNYNLDGGAYFFWDPLAAVALVEPGVVDTASRRLAVIEATGPEHGATVETPDGAQIEVAQGADRQAFEEAFLTGLNGGIAVTVEVPEPDVTVSYDGEGCVFDGPTAFEGAGPTVRIVAELVNMTETTLGVTTGLHDGVSWNQLLADAAALEDASEPPAYWVPTSMASIQGASMTGGRWTVPLDLAAGTHALVCAAADGRLFPLTDLEVTAGR